LCGQKLCKWNDDICELLRTNHYVDVQQELLSSNGFRNYSYLKFKRKNNSKLEKYQNDKSIQSDYYVIEDSLYIRYNSKWYGPYEYKKITDINVQNKLSNLCCNRYCIFDGIDLYVKSENEGWIIAEKYIGQIGYNKQLYKIYIDNDMNMIVNVPYTPKHLDDWNCYMDEPKLQSTVLRYKKLYCRGHQQLGYFNEELKRDQMDDVYFGKGNKETILDRLYIYVYGICKKNIKDIVIDKPETESKNTK
jgi:hypothetical protein